MTKTSSSASSATSGSHHGTAPSGLPENLNERSELARRCINGGSTSRSKFLRTLTRTSFVRPARSFGNEVILLRSTSKVSREAQHLVTVDTSSILFPDANRCRRDFGRFGKVLNELSPRSSASIDTHVSSDGSGETMAFSAATSVSRAPHRAIHSGSALSSQRRSDSRFSSFNPPRSGSAPSPPRRFPSASRVVKNSHSAIEPGRLSSLAPLTSTRVSRVNLRKNAGLNTACLSSVPFDGTLRARASNRARSASASDTYLSRKYAESSAFEYSQPPRLKPTTRSGSHRLTACIARRYSRMRSAPRELTSGGGSIMGLSWRRTTRKSGRSTIHVPSFFIWLPLTASECRRLHRASAGGSLVSLLWLRSSSTRRSHLARLLGALVRMFIDRSRLSSPSRTPSSLMNPGGTRLRFWKDQTILVMRGAFGSDGSRLGTASQSAFSFARSSSRARARSSASVASFRFSSFTSSSSSSGSSELAMDRSSSEVDAPSHAAAMSFASRCSASSRALNASANLALCHLFLNFDEGAGAPASCLSPPSPSDSLAALLRPWLSARRSAGAVWIDSRTPCPGMAPRLSGLGAGRHRQPATGKIEAFRRVQ